MRFETKQDVLDWYEKQPRSLTHKFISAIPWDDVDKYPLDKRFVPVLLYMRDVETLTDMYHEELLRTPTGKDPVIAKFMERWGVEELTHGEVINRFLNQAGIVTDEKWQAQVRKTVSKLYRMNTYLITSLTNLIGKKFTATHMTFGAIHEMSTAQGYRRLIELADHPVLTKILGGILREESAHTQFYRSVALIELRQNELSRRIARAVIDRFWQPVGQGSLHKSRTHYMINTLFGGISGLELLEKTVNDRVKQFPGFADLTRITETVKDITRRGLSEAEAA